MDSDFRKLVVCVFVTLLLTTSLAFGQGIVAGSISGTAQDPQQAVVSGADVAAKNTATNQELKTKTSDIGFFAFRVVPIGTYTVTVEAPGFRKLQISNVVVLSGQENALGLLTLQLGTVGETLVIEGSAPLVESTTPAVSASFGAKEASQLPLGGGFDQLAFYTPGVVTAGSNGFSNNNGADVSVNGQRGRNNNFQIDGQANNDNSVAGPSIFIGNEDIIQEFKIITNNYDVSYGRNSGSIINYVTKSGSNSFHGSAFETYRGSFADSLRNQDKSSLFGFCAPGEDPNVTGCTVPTVPRSTENIFGGTVGGPIVPDKIWFFGSYLEDRFTSSGSPSTSGSALVPTATGLAQLQAAFPGSPAINILNAISPAAIPIGNPTTSPCADSASTGCGPLGGAPPGHIVVSDGVTSAPIEFGTITRFISAPFVDYEASGRVDMQVTSKDRFFARYFFQQNNQVFGAGRGAAGAWVDIPGRGQQIALDHTHTFSPNLVNQIRFSFSRAGFGFEGGSFPNCTRSNIFSCPTNIDMQGNNLDFGIQTNLPQGRLINVTQWQDNVSWVRGRHTFKFGGEYTRQRSPAVFLPNINGSHTFSGSTTGCAAAFPGLTAVTGTACSFSRLLADTPSNIQLADGPSSFPFKEQDAALYFGDDWRITETLTLNFGVRWEYFQQAVNLLSAISVATQTGPNPFWDTTLPLSVTTLPVIPNDRNNFGPSIGFAWSPRFGNGLMRGIFGEDKTVIRGGYRINYDPAFYNIYLNMATAAPVVNLGAIAGCTSSCLPTTGFTGADVRAAHLGDIPTGVNPGVRNQTRVTDNFHNPYVQSWSLGIQRELGRSVAAEVRYVGSRTVGQFQTFNGNPELGFRDAAGNLIGGLAVDFPGLIPAGVTPCNDTGPDGTPFTADDPPGFATARADCNFTNLRMRGNTSWANYHGLQTELRFRSFYGFSGGAAYTWSKTMDNVSEIFSTGTGATTVAGAQNPFDINRGERSESGLSFPHNFTVWWLYELPFQKSQQGLIGKVLGGWEWSGTYRYTTGQLYTPADDDFLSSYCQFSFDINFFGINTCRPFAGNPAAPVDMVGQCTDPTLADCGLIDYNTLAPITASEVRWIYNDDNAALFFGTPYGNVRRNPGVRGDAVNTVGMGLYKNTKLTERVTFRLGAQVYNLLNTSFRGVPDPFITSGNFAAGGSFANTFFNDSGGDSTNPTYAGISRRRLVLGAKIIF